MPTKLIFDSLYNLVLSEYLGLENNEDLYKVRLRSKLELLKFKKNKVCVVIL